MKTSPLRAIVLFALLLAALPYATAQDRAPPTPAPLRPATPTPQPNDPPAAGASLPGGKPFTRITADMLNFDYEKHVAIFEGNVTAADPQLTLLCRKMVVYFSEKGSEVTSIEATLDVRMKQQTKEAFGEKAVFTRETGNIVLSEGKPRLLDENGNWIVSRGGGIIYNINTKIMRVDKPEMEVQSSGGGALSPSQKK